MNTSSTTTPIKRAALLLLVLLSASAAMADIYRITLTDNCINSFPWSEDFDFLAPNTVPDCWDNSASTSSTLNDHPDYLWGVHRYNGDGNQMLRMSNYSVEPGTAIINSPMIVLPSEGEIELKFNYSHTATCGPFTVKISGDGGATFVDLASYSRTSSSNSTLNPGVFSEAFIPLTEYAGQTVMLQFYANPNHGTGAIFVDNIEIYVPPTCRNPYNITVDNITSTTAELSWNIPADMQSYTVRYKSTQTTRLEEGFENGIDGWTLRDCDNQTGISDAFFYSGQYAFRFHFSSTPPQYLISPMLTGIDEGMSLEFYYRNWTSSYPETFQIGISFYDNEIESFVFLNEITVEDEQWHHYSETIPIGTKYICWKYTSFNQYYLYIDDIFAGSSNPDSEWQTMTVVGNGKQVSTTLTGLTQSSLYEVQVKSNYDEAEWSEVITFNTHTDFENVSDEYTIYSATGWDLFCDALEDNDTYNRFIGKTVKLGADISVTRMAGSSYHDFMGTFDGQGHTLTIDYGTAENPINEEYAAPFRNVESGANIHSLNVDGHIYTSKKYASGIVGCQYGTVTVNNCRSSVIIHSSKSGDGTHGGIVATQHNTLTVSGCVFDGRLLTTNGTTYCSGLVGYHNNGTCTISDCLYAPAEVNFASGESYINTGATFCRNYSGTPANCYYTKALGEAQGKLVHSIIPGEGVLMEMIGEATEYDVSGITLYGTGLMYNDVLYASNGDEVSFNLLAPESFFAVTYTPEGGTATTLTPVNGVYSFTMPNTNVVIDAVTEYLIHNATEWNNFCDALQDNDTYNRFVGKTVKLVADISVTRMAGSNYHDFMGTFDGQGHTLTVAYGSAENPISEEYAAPFRNVENGANIHGLHVDGHIYTSNKYASGIVGCQWGTVTISNCRSSVVIHSSMSGDGTHGGIVAVQHTTLTVSGCVLDGRLLTTNGTTYCSGLVGYRNNGTCTISDCLYAPAEVNMASGESKINTGATFARNWTMPDDANCYYTETLGTAQGKLAHTNPAVLPVGEATATYDVSDLAFYGNGVQFGEVFYYDSERNFLRTIAGYGTGNGGWYLIASPVVEAVTPSEGNGLLTNAYDLYRLNPTHEDNEWENYKAGSFNLEAGKGYVYANSGDVTLVFSGTPTAATAPFAVPLNYDADDDRKCWNLVGNPFACAAYLDRPYYLIDANGMGINPEPIQPTTPIPPCTAVFVKAVAAGDTAVFGTQP